MNTTPIEDAELIIDWMVTPNADDNACHNMPATVFYACYRLARAYQKEHEVKDDPQETTHAEWCAARGRTVYKNAQMAIDQIRTPQGVSGTIRDCMAGMRNTIDELTAALNSIAQLADSGSALHKATFDPHDTEQVPPGWRVVEAMRERALEVLAASDSIAKMGRYKSGDRIRVKFGRERGHYGTVVHCGGDDGTYYGIKLDADGNPIGYSEYELDPA